MLVRKYTATNLKDGLQQVKADLGEHATILSTRTIPRGMFGRGLELTATVSPMELATIKPRARRDAQAAAPALAPPAAPSLELRDVARFLSPVRQELRSLQRQMQTLTSNSDRQELQGTLDELRQLLLALSPTPQAPNTDLAQTLIDRGIRPGVAHDLAAMIHQRAANEPLPSSEAERGKIYAALTARVMARQLRCLPPLDDTGAELRVRVVTLVGPPGVGKTTTLAKIATHAALIRGLQVGIVGCDSGHLGAVASLAQLARLIDAPFERASTGQELRDACLRLQHCNLVLIDPPGQAASDTGEMDDLVQLLDGMDIDVLLLLNADMRPMEVDANLHAYSVLHPRGLVFTKLDQAVVLGTLYDATVTSGLPVTYLTNGRRIPQDMEPADPDRIASLVMGIQFN